jgi:hypothetical protein
MKRKPIRRPLPRRQQADLVFSFLSGVAYEAGRRLAAGEPLFTKSEQAKLDELAQVDDDDDEAPEVVH